MRYAGTLEDFNKGMNSVTQAAFPTETIQGARAEETELAFSSNMDLLPGPAETALCGYGLWKHNGTCGLCAFIL
jgi:hypothetical protein